MAAFNTRPYWLRSLDFKKPYVDQITKMVSDFGSLGLVLKREINTEGMPPVVYVETLPPKVHKLAAAPAPPDKDASPVSEEFAHARFGGLRRRR
jgi:hypothetical protein